MRTVVVFRATDQETMDAGFADLGLETCFCHAPYLQTTNGLTHSRMLTDEQLELLPEVTSPVFLVDWRGDEMEEVIDADGNVTEKRLDWPMYDVEYVDIDGNTQTRRQGAGKII